MKYDTVAKLNETPGEELESAINFNLRNTRADPYDYLRQFLRFTSQLAYATKDESWGELEKELQIIIRNNVRWKRSLDFITDTLELDDEGIRTIEQLGEEHWRDNHEREKRMANLRERFNQLRAETA